MPVTEYKVLRGVVLRASEAWPLLHSYPLSEEPGERNAQLKRWIQKELPVLNKFHELNRLEKCKPSTEKCPHHVEEEKLDTKLFADFPASFLSFYTFSHDQEDKHDSKYKTKTSENDQFIAVGLLIKRLKISQSVEVISPNDQYYDEIYEHLEESLKPELYKLINYTQLLFIQNDCSCVQ